MSTESSAEAPEAEDDVASLLRTDDVQEHRAAPGGGGHPDKFGVLLKCGMVAIVKPVKNDDTRRQAANEEAAWLIAHALGWLDLVGVTVQRSLKDPGGTNVQASLQQLWDSAGGTPEWVPDRALFDESDAWRVAVFDYIVCNQDRSGNNWIATLDSDGQRHLRLVDHGHAFGFPGDQRNSEWSAAKAGQDPPEEILEDVRRLGDDPGVRSEISRLVGETLAQELFDRVQALCRGGTIPP